MIKFMMLLVCCWGNFAQATEQTQPCDKLVPLGSGQMNYWLWTIYDATFSVINVPFNNEKYPQALQIHYQKNITKQALIKATVEQWQVVDRQYKPDWLTKLNNIWPDIRSGNTLKLCVDAQQVSTFYLNGKPLGIIDDPNFGPTFLAIWLSAKTSQPKLRQQLLGEGNE